MKAQEIVTSDAFACAIWQKHFQRKGKKNYERFCVDEGSARFEAACCRFWQEGNASGSKGYDLKGETPLDIYRQAVKIGFTEVALPKEFGGLGLGCTTQCVLTEELSRWEAGIANALGATSLACKPILIAGNDAQKKYAVELVQAGDMLAFGLTEPDAGSDAAALKTTAVECEGGYILNGRKCFITNAPYAKLFVIFAKTQKGIGSKGISAFIVEGDRPGVSTGRHEDKMGLRLSAAGDVILENVFVPKENLLGEPGQGFKIAMKTLDASRVEVGAAAVGIAQSAIDYSVDYAKGRICFGAPIAKLQAIQFMLADMQIQTQAARSLVYGAAEMVDNNIRPYTEICAAAKCFAGDVAMKVTTDAVQIHSGYGYMRDYPVEKLMRDAKLFQIFEGTNQIQRVVVAGSMLK